MTGRSPGRTRRVVAALSAGLGLLAVACAKNAPQDALSPEGPFARRADSLFRPVFWIAAGIFFLVEGLLVYAVVRFRQRSERDVPVQTHGNRRLEIAWTIVPALLMLGVAIPTVATIFSFAEAPAGRDVVNVKVTGHQWWWEYEYTDLKTPDGQPLKTANELVIPVGRPVFLAMTSEDVIHSYWVPKISAGKQDVIPGRTTHLTLQADRPGVYRGQCAEFCALSHANMRLRVIAQSPGDFERWVQGQLEPAAALPEGLALQRLTSTCAACHTVRGVPNVGGITGPDLTHFASRTSFAGSMLEMTADNIALWLRGPADVKPGQVPPMMPDYGLTEEEIAALVAYLRSLT